MNIKQTMRRFLEFLEINRRTGHTKLLNSVAKNNDVYIIVHNVDMKREFDPEIQDKIISIGNISILQGAPNKPVLLDNKVLMDLLNDATDKIDDVEKTSYQRKKTLQRIKEMITDTDLRI